MMQRLAALILTPIPISLRGGVEAYFRTFAVTLPLGPEIQRLTCVPPSLCLSQAHRPTQGSTDPCRHSLQETGK
ncbi:hypothetical protein AOLI_G00241660 [Acnodon oligacanthus]